MNRCPTAQDLEQWLDEELSDARQADLAKHVGVCADCQATLERLTEKTGDWPGDSASRAGTPSDPPSAFLTQLKQSPPAAASGGASISWPDWNKPPADEVPVVAGYEVLGELGRGGMGVVYKARHQALNRLVALKMILSGAHAGPRDHERFRQEAEAVARLHHPNIVQIFDIGASEGRPYSWTRPCRRHSKNARNACSMP